MKKILLYSLVLTISLFSFTSCEKDEIGGVKLQDMAGEWYVVGHAIDADGNIVYEDVFDLGHFHLDTYNTASNDDATLWIDDHGTFWDFKVKVDVKVDAKTFSVTEAQNVSYDSKVDIIGGEILLGAATTPTGMAADSIVFMVSFNDDTYPADFGFTNYRIAGYRYTGFVDDEGH